MQSETKTVIFSGPTLSKEEIENRSNALVFGPVSQGDILKVYKEHHPTHIGIIDGYYENVPSVWHKEILYVMSQGVQVFGAASMGALRSAELHRFGMKGIGKIFELYFDQHIEDDDEVAVLHGPEELGFPALTEAMINIRLTIDKAKNENILSPLTASNTTNFMKSLFYKNRKRNLLMEYVSSQISHEEFQAFKIWYENNYINQKQIDALHLVETLMRSVKEGSKTEINYTFYKTSFFKRMFLDVEERSGGV